ncbi:hypothetical protein BABINDRAFT_165550 [Babjeviella inositovora NRRL Y-12698]|uniref:Magnesium-dependent phosphatase-1 n=1 Tax=Babjeviella inositovora NRRL Y-12698 TaxID=984486 RepID=A0A1E3QWJ5_9ASCO|nr:uncharacterized protein BABINDRAFT_165550 [Babjeviella inositovora NRRL Y-12698]ODQ82053.1 hypothetical protein BABINDRAFT_165550 [Babjeviella inositovora NRRL Y-12698]
MSYPKAVVFDLDYTLWPCWCDTHLRPPIMPHASGRSITDSAGMQLEFYRDVESIIHELRENGVLLIAASRTAAPKLAKEILTYLKVTDPATGQKVSSIQMFDTLQWGQGTKINHIKKACATLDISWKEHSLILFDDESRNKDVRKINVQFAHVPDWDKGLTRSIFDRVLQEWRENNRQGGMKSASSD